MGGGTGLSPPAAPPPEADAPSPRPSRPGAPRSGALDVVASWPVRVAAAGVVRADGGGTTVVDEAGAVDRPLPWASVTKLLVALAVLVAVEEGTLGLDDPAGPPGATVRHLLAHASGLAPDGGVLAPPGRRRIYSNAGYEVLADTLARRAGMPLTDYVRTGVTLPLDMRATDIPPGSSPASGAVGPLRDLLALAAELLAPRLVAPATLALATTVAFPGLAGVLPGFGKFDPCDWGLGFELRDAKDPHWTGRRNSPATFGHFGQRAGFLWVDPGTGLACGALSDGTFGPWAAGAWPAMADAVVERWGASRGDGAGGSGGGAPGVPGPVT